LFATEKTQSFSASSQNLIMGLLYELLFLTHCSW